MRTALSRDRGWNRKKSDDKSAPDLVWTLDERSIDHDTLADTQAANHYRDSRTLTTKAGLTRTLEDQAWHASGSRARGPSGNRSCFPKEDDASIYADAAKSQRCSSRGNDARRRTRRASSRGRTR